MLLVRDASGGDGEQLVNKQCRERVSHLQIIMFGPPLLAKSLCLDPLYWQKSADTCQQDHNDNDDSTV